MVVIAIASRPQRCAPIRRFHELAEFDGTRRSCRMRLQRHNARRRKKAAERPTSKKMALAKGRLAAAGFQHHAPALSVPKQVTQDCISVATCFARVDRRMEA